MAVAATVVDKQNASLVFILGLKFATIISVYGICTTLTGEGFSRTAQSASSLQIIYIYIYI